MTKLTGKCHCGANTFEVNAEPAFQFVCYCTNCRVLNSGGHLCGMMFDEGSLTKAENTKEYSFTGGSGQSIDVQFCPTCATHLYAYPRSVPGKVVIRANTIENADFKPQQELFPESAFEWDKFNMPANG